MQPIRQFKPDGATDVFDWGVTFSNANAVLLSIDGEHGTFLNHASDKTYLIVSGSVVFYVEEEMFHCDSPSCFVIEKGKKHKMIGAVAKLVCISEPPFDPKSEDILNT